MKYILVSSDTSVRIANSVRRAQDLIQQLKNVGLPVTAVYEILHFKSVDVGELNRKEG